MDHAGLGEHLHQRIDGGEDGIFQEFAVVLIVILLASHGLALSGKLFGRDVPERPHAGEPPVSERLV